MGSVRGEERDDKVHFSRVYGEYVPYKFNMGNFLRINVLGERNTRISYSKQNIFELDQWLNSRLVITQGVPLL